MSQQCDDGLDLLGGDDGPEAFAVQDLRELVEERRADDESKRPLTEPEVE
jgi:hypothetical protein